MYNIGTNKQEKEMTTYQLVQIMKVVDASTINPWVLGGLIALAAGFVVATVVAMIANRLP